MLRPNFDIALSPCPNDSFLFHAWIKNYVGKSLPVSPIYADIQTLNQWLKTKNFPLIKISYACLPLMIEKYEMLPVGSALGYNCGPKLISKTAFSLNEMKNKRILIPGENTTANLLFDLLAGPCLEKKFCSYEKIFGLLDEGAADAGLIIHESRFTFSAKGFHEIADLGEIWHQKYQAPLPLGGLAIKRDIPDSIKKSVCQILQLSLEHAYNHTPLALPFVKELAQEKEEDIVIKHISTYVNEETYFLSQTARQAICLFLNYEEEKSWLYSG